MTMHRFPKYITAAVVLLAAALTAAAIPQKPYPPRLVNDFAGILDQTGKAMLEKRLDAFSDSTSNQITVVTVNDLEGYSPAEYAALAAHGFRMLADAMEANLPYRIDCPALLFCGVHDRAEIWSAEAWAAQEEEEMTPEKMSACMEALGF